MLKIAILFSGEGTTLQNLIDAARDGRLPRVEIVRAVSSRQNAGGIARCAAAGVPCVVAAKKEHPDAADHTRAVFAHLPPDEIDLVCLAGWMSRLVLQEPWLSNRVMNVHPSLLPAFGGPGMYGRRVHEAVLARGCKVTGCTVHYVNNEVDGGPILLQRCVPVGPSDTPERLAARVQSEERVAYVAALLLAIAARHQTSQQSARPIDFYRWLDPWVPVNSDEQRRSLEVQLRHEVTSAGHPLYPHLDGASVVGRSEACDDIAVRLANGQFACVHLVWQGRENAEYPSTAIYGSFAEFSAAEMETEWAWRLAEELAIPVWSS